MRLSRARRAWTLLLCVAVPLCIVLARSSVAQATETVRIRELLRVQPGATCLSAEQLAAQVEQWLDDAPIAGDVVIVVDGSATDPRSVRVNVVRGGQTVAHRAFEPGPVQCEHMHAAVALAIAMALKASRDDERARPVRIAVAAEPPARRWSVAGSVLATYRLLPELAPGLELSVRYDLNEHFGLRMSALGAAGFGVRLTGGAGSFDATLAAARADFCGRRKLAGALHGAVCLGFLGGMLHAAGTEVAMAESSNVPAFALASAGELALELSERWSIALGISMTVLLHGVRVGVEDGAGMRGSSLALPSPGFALGLGPAYYFE